MRIKKILGLSLVLGCLVSTTAFAYSSTPIHGAEIERSGPYAAGFAHTEWTTYHYTAIKIGLDYDAKYGSNYTQTDVVSGFGTANSWYDRG